MKTLLPTLALALTITSGAIAQDREQLSSSSQAFSKMVQKNFFSPPKRQTVRPVTRVLLNTNVDKHEGNATVNRESTSSPVVIFHIRDGKVVPGHAFDY